MEDIEIIKNLVNKLDGVMALEIDPRSESGKQRLEALSNSKLLFIVSSVSDDYLLSTTTKQQTNISQPATNPCITNQTNTNISLNINEPKVSDVDLTKREKQVLEHIAAGMSNKLIARKLGISYSTVKVHVKNILSKLKKHSRLQAAVWAVELVNQGKLKEVNNCEENV